MKNIFISASFILILFLISNYIFEPTHLYYEIWWLDIPMHILGGVGFASLFIFLLNHRNKKITFKKVIISVMIIGVLWEMYEYLILHLYLERDWNGILDTIKDLCDDFIGGSIAYLVNSKTKN